MEQNETFDKEYTSETQTTVKVGSDKQKEPIIEETETDLSKYSLNKPKRRIIKAKVIDDKN